MGERPNDNDSKSGNNQRNHGTFARRLSVGAQKKVILPFNPKHVDYFDWDDPKYDIAPDDDRWILPNDFDIGAHPWYQSQPREKQIEIGMARYANTAKVGSQFEEALIMGMMAFVQKLPPDSPNRDIAMDEAREETQHIQMFQKFVKKTGVEVDGVPAWFHAASPLLTVVAKKFPVGFLSLVLAGEEPIDRTQRTLIQHPQAENLHPLIRKVMEVHVKEEARHISFANSYVRDKIHNKKVRRVGREALAVSMPVLMRIFADVILRPSKQDLKSMGIPEKVADEVWWDSEHGRQSLNDLFVNVRRFADEIGLRDGEQKSRLGRMAWKAMGIDG